MFSTRQLPKIIAYATFIIGASGFTLWARQHDGSTRVLGLITTLSIFLGFAVADWFDSERMGWLSGLLFFVVMSVAFVGLPALVHR